MKTALIGFITTLFLAVPAAAVFAQYGSYGTGAGSSGFAVQYYRTGAGYYPASSEDSDTGEGTSGTDMAAAGEQGSFRGRIVDIDPAGNRIIVQALTSNETLIFTVSPSQLEHLRIDRRVRVLYDPQTHVARRIMNTAYKNGRWYNY